MQGNDGIFKPEHHDNKLKPACGVLFSQGIGDSLCPPARRALVKPIGEVSTWQGCYRLVSRQPAASASSTEQNQRVPLLICILIFAYQRLVG